MPHANRGKILLAAAALSLAGASRGIPDTVPGGKPNIRSESALVYDATTRTVLYSKNESAVRPVASLTKLVAAMVLFEQGMDLSEDVTITEADKDRLKWSRSRLKVGYKATAEALLHAALMGSDNRAMAALARSTGLSRDEFVEKMNERVTVLGLTQTGFADPTGVSTENVSSAAEMECLLAEALTYRKIAEISSLPDATIELIKPARKLRYVNSNRLARSSKWEVLGGKTGFTVEAGHCLVFSTTVAGREIHMVFLGAREKLSRFGDAARVKRWITGKAAGKGTMTAALQ